MTTKRTDKELAEKIREWCEQDLRDGSQTDNMYFGKDKNDKCQGSIYWVPGAETWLYYCQGKSEYGQCGDLLADIDDQILLFYYNNDKYVKENINEWLEKEDEEKENEKEV